MLSVAISLLLRAAPAAGAPVREVEPCISMPAGRYCLGDPVGKPKRNPPHRMPDGYATLSTPDGLTFAGVLNGRVAWVARLYEPKTYPHYRTLLGQLSETFGEPTKDRSHFPPDAESDSSRAREISLGRAWVDQTWISEQSRLRVSLVWDKDRLTIRYVSSDLTALPRHQTPAGSKF